MRGINHREHAVQIEAQPHPSCTPAIGRTGDEHRLVQTHTVGEIKLEYMSARLHIQSHRKTVVEYAVAIENWDILHIQRSASALFIAESHPQSKLGFLGTGRQKRF